MRIEKRTESIRLRRKWMPQAYRAVYDKAVKGNSLRAAINSQCLECCCYKIEDIRNCADLACPLCPYQILQTSRGGVFSGPESMNSDSKVDYVG